MKTPAFTVADPPADLGEQIASRCAYIPAGRDQCKRLGITGVAGVPQPFCVQHARIVATAPGASGYVRPLPVGVTAIVAELNAATTQADVDRCRGAIARQMSVCGSSFGLKPEIGMALAQARTRVKGGRS